MASNPVRCCAALKGQRPRVSLWDGRYYCEKEIVTEAPWLGSAARHAKDEESALPKRLAIIGSAAAAAAAVLGMAAMRR